MDTNKIIYMDYHATTPVDPRAVEVMLPCFTQDFGNAHSSGHCYGWRAEHLAEQARIHVAHFIGAASKEVVFTSGATESNNMALKGVFATYREKGNHIITQVTEHKCVLETCKYLETQGAKVTYLGVDQYGQIRLDELKKAITDQTILVSIMFANNEIGTVQPVAEIGKITRERGVLFHCDAAQAAGKIPIDVNALNIDLLSFSGHKMYGPKGVAALYVRKKNPRVRLQPLINGGGQEEALRSGTLNIPGIVGFGKACEIAQAEMKSESERLGAFRDRLKQGIEKGLNGKIHLNGHPTERLCNNLNLSFPGIDAESLLSGISERFAVSSGSACASGNAEPSHVLKAIGLKPEYLHSTIRFGLGRFNTAQDIEEAIEHVIHVVKRLGDVAPKLNCI